MQSKEPEYLDPTNEPEASLDAQLASVFAQVSQRDREATGQHWPAWMPDESDAAASHHFVQFYEADGFLLDAVHDFIGTAIRAGDAGVVIATSGHREGLEERFRSDGLDLTSVRAAGRFLALDAFETLSQFMIDGEPDPAQFRAAIGGILSSLPRSEGRVCIFGEMVALLVADGNHDAAIRLEQLWNDAQSDFRFSLFCAYPMDQFGGESFAELFAHVNAEHTHVIPAESFTTLSTTDDRLRAVAELQQHSRWLQVEIIERKHAEERLRVALAAERAAREEAETALRLRDEFLSIAAHELKTPLTGLSGQAQLTLLHLRRTGQIDPRRVTNSLESIVDQAGKLSRLLNQLLDISRLDAGKLAIERQPADLALVFGQVVAGMRAFADRHVINFTAPASVPAHVDSLRLEQVLINLVTNAITHSPDDAAIDVVLSPSSGSAVELSVRDHGDGIPSEMRGQIFERFFQAPGDRAKRGLGLGLYLSREIVELHDGEIRVESPADGGTRFVVRLPIDTA